jgi:hypothetical protein
MVAYLSKLGKRVGGSTRGYGPSLVCSTCKDGRSRHLGAVPRTVWRRATGEVLGAVVAHRAPESVLAAQHSCTRPAGRRLHPTAHPPLCKAVWHAAVYVPSGGNFLTFWTFLETSAVPLPPFHLATLCSVADPSVTAHTHSAARTAGTKDGFTP